MWYTVINPAYHLSLGKCSTEFGDSTTHFLPQTQYLYNFKVFGKVHFYSNNQSILYGETWNDFLIVIKISHVKK